MQKLTDEVFYNIKKFMKEIEITTLEHFFHKLNNIKQLGK